MVAGVVCVSRVADQALMTFGREWAPRVELVDSGVLLLDARGLVRLFGSMRQWIRELRQAAAARGWTVRVAVAATRTAALLLAVGRAESMVCTSGQEATALAPLPLSLLGLLDAWEVSSRQQAAPSAREERAGGGPSVRPRARHRPFAGRARHYRLAPGPREVVPAEGDLASSPTTTADLGGRRLDLAVERLLQTCARWGVSTLGELAALKEGEVAARLGETGRRWHRWARGCDALPLVDRGEARVFEEACELEWPVEGLEPLSFVLARVLEPLCSDLRREERGAAVVRTTLTLVSKSTHVRLLQLPAPMNDPKVLRTLILLDLEAHPPDAAIDRVAVRLEPLPGRRVQYSLFRRPLPAPDQVATLMARLDALMGAGRCGSPRLVDSHRPGAYAVVGFDPEAAGSGTDRDRVDGTAIDSSKARDSGQPRAVLRRFRRPLRVQVQVADGRPVRVKSGRALMPDGTIDTCAGPWRTSGLWWHPHGWSRDEWDVALRNGPVYRLSRAHATDEWVLEGVWD